jgi:2-succinyl-5-enolpyruvyl-6-hydroxy-3-cyclohexene-1-carboxylate synthase
VHLKQKIYHFAAALKQRGLEDVIICPGSRNAPLIDVFTQLFKCHSIIDERSAGFVALGMALATQKGVAIICTSGTAALNFYPAVAEAFYAKVPLLILTAGSAGAQHRQLGGTVHTTTRFICAPCIILANHMF